MIDIKSFKTIGSNKSLIAVILLSFTAVILGFVVTTYYLAYNELRSGYHLYDPLIAFIPPIDLSFIIFICTYSCIVIGLLFSMTSPTRIIRTNLAILCLLFYRMICMYLIPLEPPPGIIPLQDEFLMHTTYGQQVLLKDLFFSGHTASVVLLYHMVDNKIVSRVMLFMSFIIGTMLIVQHVHYTIDVVVAYAFAHIAFLSGVWLTEKSILYSRFALMKTAKSVLTPNKI